MSEDAPRTPEPITVRPLTGLPEIRAGDDLAALIADRVGTLLRAYDVVVVTSKVVSKAAGLVVDGDREQLIDESTDRLVARRGPTRIVRTKAGLTMAAAGLDESNTESGTVVVLPLDPDAEASALRGRLEQRRPDLAGRLAVVVTDTAGRPWRVGQTDMAIGVSGIRPLRSYVGSRDQYGNELRVTEPAVADELASAADLAAGKLGRSPVAVVSGIEPALFTDGDGPGAAALVRAESEDLFGLGAHQAVVEAVRPGSGRPRGFAAVEEAVGELIVLALEAVDGRLLDVAQAGDEPARIRVRPAAGADVADACVAYGALLERLRVLGRAYGVTASETRDGSAPLPAEVVLAYA